MAIRFMSFTSTVLLILLLASSPFFISEARPLKLAKSPHMSYITSEGPSPGGRGHKYINAQTTGGIKHSGPAPGVGNYYTTKTPQTLGGIKHSGPSHGGEGNHHTTSTPRVFLGGIKHSGPSHGGQGNYYTTSAPQTLGGLKHSGPSPHGPGN
ncbi:conserved hypothetical protein [Ricinus communis]|uniref:Uncharacterized protein n=1 Tax=Ricinus communis TaxID=3988 RepID=B9R753_RICCO|nr:conserved hypothetical protein [Ricinus communis]|eukprot:XP_025013559.1 uncharacterized protein LOC112535269 [Ricinus communis]